jgi:hypothetical protein
VTLSFIFAQEKLANNPLKYPSEPPLELYIAPETPKYSDDEVLHKNYLFYHAQESGVLPYQRLV